MTSSSPATASPPAPAAKTSAGHAAAILAIILVSYFMILLDAVAPASAMTSA